MIIIAYQADTVWTPVLPSFRGYGTAISRGTVAPSRKAGTTAGQQFSGGFSSGTKRLAAGVGALLFSQSVKNGLKDSISRASDLGETQSKVNVIFGRDGAKALGAFTKGSATALGQTKQQILDASATFGVFGKQAGLRGRDLAKFSGEFGGLASDMASFSNTSPADAVEAIGAALRGEAEPIRRYGVLLDAAAIKAEAVSGGLVKATKDTDKIKQAQLRAMIAQRNYNAAVKENGKDSTEALRAQATLGAATRTLATATQGTVGPLTQQQKVLATQSLIYKQTKDAQGDFARTSGGLANQQRILSAQWAEAKTRLGTQLLPVVTRGVTLLNKNFEPAVEAVSSAFRRSQPLLEQAGVGLSALWERVKGIDGATVDRGIGAISAAVSQLGPLVTNLTGSLPALGPSLDAAGTGFAFVARHADLVGKALPFLLAGFAAYKTLQAANNVIGRQSVIGFGLQIGSTIALALANRALAKSQQSVAIASSQATAAHSVGTLARIRDTVATVASAVAQRAAAVASRVFAAGQWLLNAALTANPIGLVIALLVGIGVALVVAYKKSETFRTIVDGALRVAGRAFSWLWARAKEAFSWLKQNWPLVLGVITGPLGLAVLAVYKNWAKIRGYFSDAWAWVKDQFSKSWAGLKLIVTNPVTAAKNVVKSLLGATGLRSHFTAVVSWIGTTFKTGWDKLKGYITSPVTAARTKLKEILGAGKGGMQTLFSSAVSAIGTILDGLKAKASIPINFVINTVYNDGIRAALNKIPGVNLARATPIAMKSGGVLPGWTPGRDVHTFISPTGGRLALSGGEAIMRPEFTRAVGGERGVERLNRLARQGRAFSRGGVFHGGAQVVPGSGNRHRSGYPWARYAGDFPNPAGTPVRSWKDGTVAVAKSLATSYGKHVRVNHGAEQTLYAHMSKILVNVGQRLRGGQQLGAVGNTGNSFGNHLHWELAGGSGAVDSGGGGVAEKIMSWVGSPTQRLLAGLKGKMTAGLSGPFAGIAKAAGTSAISQAFDWAKNSPRALWNKVQTVFDGAKGAAREYFANGSGDQMKNAATIASVGSRGGRRAQVIGIATAIVESGLRNLTFGDRDSVGLFQQRAPWGSYADRTNPRKSAEMFYNGGQGGQRGLYDIPGWRSMDMGRAAQAVQVSAFPGRYGQEMGRASKYLDQLKFDNGGYLQPGLNMAFNGTGKPERVLTDPQWDAMARGRQAPSKQVDVSGNTFYGFVPADVVEEIRRADRQDEALHPSW